jgi:hypothetical protein
MVVIWSGETVLTVYTMVLVSVCLVAGYLLLRPRR